MATMPATIAFLKQIRGQLISDIKDIESGRVEFIKVAGGRKNANDERLIELHHRLGNLEQTIVIFEKTMA